MDEEVRIDCYLTVEEILNNLPVVRCDECGRVFQNASACRFHRLKQHMNLDVSNTNERRLFHRSLTEPRVIMAFYCPDNDCRSKKTYFDGLRNLKQHYLRSHCEKKLVCEKCGYKCVLEKDINYHRKIRCSKLKHNVTRKKENAKKSKSQPKKRGKRQTVEEEPKKKKVSRRRRRRSPSTSDEEEEENESFASSSSSTKATPTREIVQPIFFIVNPENVDSVVNSLQKALVNPADIVLNSIGREPPNDLMSFMNVEEPIVPNVPTGPTSISFATQYDPEPTTSYCERGTMMNEEPLNFFDPPFGEEFGDMTHGQKNGAFDFSGPSTSHQPQTRSFGTMFENVTTCNTGTSMIDESFDSEFLRDIETQTPSYMIQHQQTSATNPSDDWPWRMTDGDI